MVESGTAPVAIGAKGCMLETGREDAERGTGAGASAVVVAGAAAAALGCVVGVMRVDDETAVSETRGNTF